MLKIKLAVGIIVGLLGYWVVGLFSPVSAAVLSIQKLPAYINTNNFKLSCTSSGGSVQFSFSKNGGGFSDFGPAIDTTSNQCVVQVDSSEISEEASYTFSVGGFSTSTIYDNSGPDAVSNYYKDGLGDGFRLHYHTPSNSDFAEVKIYRGDTPDFSADSSHEIATVPSGGNSDMTYEDHSGTNKYYDIRAIDKAGNSSALVGDGGGTTTVITTPTPKAGTGGAVTQLPVTQGKGSVLGTEASPTASPEPTIAPVSGGFINQIASQSPGPLKWILTHKKISLGIIAILAIIGYAFYTSSKRNK